jgi:hypothetical protein
MAGSYVKNVVCVALVVGFTASVAGCVFSGGGPVPGASASVGSGTDPQAMEARALALEELALQLQIADPPEVELVRFIEPTEWVMAQIDCLMAGGFAVAVTSDGSGIDVSQVPASMTERGGSFMLAQYICEAQFSVVPGDQAGLGPNQLSALYDLYLGVQVPCLEAHGIAVSSPPSRQVFIDTYGTDDMWIPYASVSHTIADADWLALNTACPQEIDTSTLGR